MRVLGTLVVYIVVFQAMCGRYSYYNNSVICSHVNCEGYNPKNLIYLLITYKLVSH